MRGKMTPKEFMDKCRLEGGILEGLKSGLDETNLDDYHHVFKDCISKMSYRYKTFCKEFEDLEDTANAVYQWENHDDIEAEE